VNDAMPLAAFGIMMVRPGLLVIGAPVFGGPFVPPTVRVGLTVLLGALMLPLVHVTAGGTIAATAMTVAGEAIVGIALSLSIRVLIGGAELAGHLAGFQIGLSYASLVDPQTGARNNVVSVLYGSLATITFFSFNGHHALLRALARSYDWIPPGQWHLGTSVATEVPRMLGIVFLLGTQLAMPVVVALLLVELALGLVSRAAPALNLMATGFSIRVGVGLLVLAASLAVVPDIIARYAPVALDSAARLAGSGR
jgi:flagellar biosynthesis protein FliR